MDSRAGGKPASGYALHCFAAGAQSDQASGHTTCYQTGQVFLLPTQGTPQGCSGAAEWLTFGGLPLAPYTPERVFRYIAFGLARQA